MFDYLLKAIRDYSSKIYDSYRYDHQRIMTVAKGIVLGTQTGTRLSLYAQSEDYLWAEIDVAFSSLRLT